MTNQTRVTAPLVELDLSDRTLLSKLGDVISCLDYGATVAAGATANTAAINSAVTAAAASGSNGFVLVPYGVQYTESSLVLADDVQLIIFGQYGSVMFLSKDHASTPTARGGIVVKSQGATGVLIRSHDYGVATDPILQLVDATNGDLAAQQVRYTEMEEISAPTTPATNKTRLYAAVNGSVTELYAKFQDGSIVPIAKEGHSANLTATLVVDPASIANNASLSTTITVTGAALGDFVLASFSLDIQELTISAHVGAANTVHVVLHNATGGAVDLASGTFSVLVLKRF